MRKRSVDDVVDSMVVAMGNPKRTRLTSKTKDPAQTASPPATKVCQGQTTPKKGAPKKPVAASAAHDLCSVQRNYSKKFIVVAFGKGPGSTKSIIFGPTGIGSAGRDTAAALAGFLDLSSDELEITEAREVSRGFWVFNILLTACNMQHVKPMLVKR